MQSTTNSSRIRTQPRTSNARVTRLLAGASFLMVGLAIGNWPTNVHAGVAASVPQAVN